jgi:hypothetical protein
MVHLSSTIKGFSLYSEWARSKLIGHCTRYPPPHHLDFYNRTIRNMLLQGENINNVLLEIIEILMHSRHGN